MLSRGFKPAKCKTALNLAKARIKLMKNKKDVPIKQLRREVAQLLLNAQDQTARIRVEHVVREEKTLVAYEMIEIYCELIVARLPIIESQKNCPLDLKEAITSLVFAAPRCGDIPELQDVRKHFTTKYGKDFIASAIELRPSSGVSRTLVEKLSAKAPDGPTKVKILKGIAEEHNIQWEPNWFKDEDLVSSGDLLKIPHTNNSNTIQMEPLNVQIADDLEEKHTYSTENPEFSTKGRVPANTNRIPPSSTSTPDFSEICSERHVPANTNRIPQSSTSTHDFIPSGNVSEGMHFSQSSGNPTDKHSWNMEFKDATAAAQAAAESAERASMAARAAAQLSIRDSSHEPGRTSATHGQCDGDDQHNQRSPSQGYTDPEEQRENRSTNSESSQSHVQYDTRQQEFTERESTYRVNADSLLQSRDSAFTPSTSKDDSNWPNSSNIQGYETEPDENPFSGDTVGLQKQSTKYFSQPSGLEDGAFSNLKYEDEKVDSYNSLGGFGQATSKQDNLHDDETIFGNYKQKDVFKEPYKNKYGFNSTAGVFDGMDKEPSELDINEKVSHNVANAVFDESGSDDEECVLDLSEKHNFSSGVPSPRHSLIQKDNPHFEPDLSESFRKSPIYAKLIEPLPLTFDDYDEPSPRSEKELQKDDSDLEIGSYDSRKPRRDSPELIRPSTIEEGESEDHAPKFDRETYSSSEGGMRANLGSLPGGQQNSWRPPYTRGDFVAVSSSSKFSEAQDEGFGSNEDDSPTFKFHVKSSATGNTEVSTRNYSPSRYEAVISASHSDIEQKSHSGNIHANMHDKRAKGPTGYFESSESSPEMTKSHQGTGISRRTKGSTRSVSSHSSSNSGDITKTGRPLSSSYSTKDSPKRQTETLSSSSKTADQSNLNDEATFDHRSGSRLSKHNNRFSPAVVEKPVTPPTDETSRASVSSEKAPSRENSDKNLSHVHPKLPDFETFTAHLQSLRTNRK